MGTSSLKSMCHEYRAVAFGDFPFLVANNPQPWDHLAGSLILSELGGAALDLWGDDYSSKTCGTIVGARSAGLAKDVTSRLDQCLR